MSGVTPPPPTGLHDIAGKKYYFSLGVAECLVNGLRKQLKGVHHLMSPKFY